MSTLRRRSIGAFGLWLLLFLFLISVHTQSVLGAATSLAYSDDPATMHVGIWGPNTVIGHQGGEDLRVCNTTQAVCTGFAVPGNTPNAQMGGFDWIFDNGNDGDVYTAESDITGGNAGCTLFLANGHRYCGVAVPPPPDGDGDGVGDADDACPAVPGPASHNGCPPPPDEDGDGIPDANDLCLGVRGVAPDGCPPPDSDGDGIPDPSDACDTEKGPAYNNGCPVPPDQDGDGVSDETDQCDDQPGPGSNNGCPVPSTEDSDGDGVLDDQDFCPSEAGSTFNSGCPDRDGDRVSDAGDQCPDIAGPADNFGCPYGLTPVGTSTPDPQMTATLVGTPDLSAPCSAVAKGGQKAFIYAEPNESSSTIRQIFYRVDNVVTVTESSGDWLRVSYAFGGETGAGWVRGSLLERGASPCARGGGDSSAVPVIPTVSVAESCPTLVDVLNGLPTELQTAYASSVDPCQMLADVKHEQEVPRRVEDVTSPYLGQLFERCPVSVPGYLAAMDALMAADQEAARQFSRNMTNGDPCANIQAYLAGTSFPTSAVDASVVVSCISKINPDHLARVVALANQLGIQVSDLGTTPCYHIGNLSLVTQLTPDQQVFYNTVKETCGSSLGAINWLVNAIESNVDFKQLNQIEFHCAMLSDLIKEYGQVTDPKDIPDQIKHCSVEWINLFINALKVRATQGSSEVIVVIVSNTFSSSETLPQHHPETRTPAPQETVTAVPSETATLVPTLEPTSVITPTEEPSIEIDVSWLDYAKDPCQAIIDFVRNGTKPKPPVIYRPRPLAPQPTVVFTPPPVAVAEGSKYAPPADMDPAEVPQSHRSLALYDEGGLGYFVAETGGQTDIHKWTEQGTVLVLGAPTTDLNESQPAWCTSCNALVWIETNTEGQSTIQYLRGAERLSFSPSDGYRFSPVTPLTWNPDPSQEMVWATVLDSRDQSHIAQFDFGPFAEETVTIPFMNATNPVAFSDVYLVYITGNQLERRDVGDLASATLIEWEWPAEDCHSPASYDRERFLFICGTTVYLQNLYDGTFVSVPIEGVSEIHNVQRIPHLANYFSFDDGRQLYAYSMDDGKLYVFPSLAGGSSQTHLIWND